MAAFWMVRAGEGGRLVPDFERLGVIAIGWADLGDLNRLSSLEAMRNAVAARYPDSKPGNVIIAGSTLHKFRSVLAQGDRIVTYDPSAREYLMGTLTGGYSYDPVAMPEHPHTRKVKWEGRVSRDRLSPGAKSTLGSVVTLFEPSEDALAELNALLSGTAPTVPPLLIEEEEQAELEVVRLDAVAKAQEFLKDRLLKIGADDMEVLVASLLRAMGYKARVTPKGPDRGRDVIASPDGLGFQAPRIKAEVKHRPNDRMGSEQVRSFLGGLRDGDCGLYVSTGGFTREAKYEADRATVPTTLIDLDDLAELIVEHYERLDAPGRTLVPLVRVYWPTS